MKRFSDPAVRRELLALKKGYDNQNDLVAAAERKLEELQDRQASLRSRIDAEGKPQATRNDAAGSGLVQALADDPSAALGDADLSALVEDEIATERAEAARRARVRVLQAAAQKLDAPIAAISRQIALLTTECRNAYAALLDACHAALVMEFARRFAALREELIDPMVAIELVHRPNAGGAYIEWGDPLMLKTFVGGNRVWAGEALLRMDDYGKAERAGSASGLVAAFVSEMN